MDVNEWVAVNRESRRGSGPWEEQELMRASLLSPHAVVDLFNNLNLFYSVVTEFCTVENNPTMSAGPG